MQTAQKCVGCRVGNLEADFQQVPYVQFFLNFHNIGVKHQ